MQPHFDPTRWILEDDLNIFKMEDDLNFFQMEDDLNFDLSNKWSWKLVCNIGSTQLDQIWRTTSIFLKMEDDFNFLTMEDDLKY